MEKKSSNSSHSSTGDMKVGTLTVHLCKAEDIKGDEMFGLGKADPFAEMWLSDSDGNETSSAMSTVKKGAASNPEWNEQLILNVDYAARSFLHIILKDKDHFTEDDYLGALKIDLTKEFENHPNEVPLRWYPVFYQSQKKLALRKVRQRGKLQLSFSFEEVLGQGASEPFISPQGSKKKGKGINWGTMFGGGQLLNSVLSGSS